MNHPSFERSQSTDRIHYTLPQKEAQLIDKGFMVPIWVMSIITSLFALAAVSLPFFLLSQDEICMHFDEAWKYLLLVVWIAIAVKLSFAARKELNAAIAFTKGNFFSVITIQGDKIYAADRIGSDQGKKKLSLSNILHLTVGKPQNPSNPMILHTEGNALEAVIQDNSSNKSVTLAYGYNDELLFSLAKSLNKDISTALSRTVKKHNFSTTIEDYTNARATALPAHSKIKYKEHPNSSQELSFPTSSSSSLEGILIFLAIVIIGAVILYFMHQQASIVLFGIGCLIYLFITCAWFIGGRMGTISALSLENNLLSITETSSFGEKKFTIAKAHISKIVHNDDVSFDDGPRHWIEIHYIESIGRNKKYRIENYLRQECSWMNATLNTWLSE